MAYHFKRGETIPEAVKRIASEEIESAVSRLTKDHRSKPAESVHEARKSIKKIRALLRVMRLELGDTYKTENAALRDIGHRLSEVRDAVAVIESFDDFRRHHANSVSTQSFSAVRRILVQRKEHAMREAERNQLASHEAAALRDGQPRVSCWQIARDGFSTIRPGIRKIYGGAQKALDRVRAHPSDENFHEWRKRVKDHWYLIRLAENLWPDMMQAERKSLKTLEQLLGDDHNFVILLSTLEKPFKPLREAIEDHKEELREAAIMLGRRIYDEKPGAFARRMQRLWELWQAEEKETEALLENKAAA